MRWALGIIGIGVVVIVAIAMMPKAKPSESANVHQTDVTVSQKGVSLSPKSFEGEDFTNFFPLAKQLGTAITWAGSVDELAKTDGAPTVVTSLAEQNGLTPIMIVGVPVESLNNAESAAQVKLQIIGWTEQNMPAMIGIGNEINYTYRDDADAFANFVSFFAEIVPAIKKISPQTQIFTVWQLEWLKGLHGGLYGGQNDPKTLSQWFLLEQFPSADFFAYTTYPMLIYQSPEEIPDTYYSEIEGYSHKPAAFSEAGWFRTGPKGWKSSAAEQATFVDRFFSLTTSLHSEFRIWPFVYDQNIPEPFTTTGLLKIDQTTSPAFTAWQEAG